MYTMLISQINCMDCGGIIRLINHLKTRIDHDKKKLERTSSKMTDESGGQQHRHPRLNRKHYNDKKWKEFVGYVSKDVHKCDLTNCSICCIGRYVDVLDEIGIAKHGQNHVFILDEDGIDQDSITDLQCEAWISDFEEAEQRQDSVFHSVLSFSRDSITIQQLYQFSVKFAR
eukprot:394806_1